MSYGHLYHCMMLSQETGLSHNEPGGSLLRDLYNAIKNDKKHKCKCILKYNISIVNIKDFIYCPRKENIQNSVICFGECTKKFQQLTHSVSLQNSPLHDAEAEMFFAHWYLPSCERRSFVSIVTTPFGLPAFVFTQVK